ncbi:MAG: helix-turn-helix domain-containing protein [Actinomycetota bacterium]
MAIAKDERSFGQRLREARTQAGLSQSELEVRSGIPKARLSRYENGHVIPSIQTLERLASALSISQASLLGDQRAFLEEFCSILSERGVRLASKEQGVRLANGLADMLEALGAVAAIDEEHEAVATITLPEPDHVAAAVPTVTLVGEPDPVR